MSVMTPVEEIHGRASQDGEVKIYSHSPILYWWPVWSVGLLMALWTSLENYQVVFVPENTVVEGGRVVAPAGRELEPPVVHVARSRWPGVLFALTLLLVIFVSTASLRGPWGLFGM